MGLFDALKKKMILKKTLKGSIKRTIKILPIERYHSVLIILDKKDSALKKRIESTFINAKITSLYNRDIKEFSAEESNFTYTYHSSDLGFGKIKRDNLLGLLNTNFDLVIDFSVHTPEFNYFVKKTKSALKIGDLHSTKNYLYDLLVDRGSSDIDYLENIKLQIHTLSQ